MSVSKQHLSEKDYLSSLIINLDREIQDIKIPYTDNKVIIGVLGDSSLSKTFNVKTIVDTAKNLNRQIFFSLQSSIDYTYSEKAINNYNFQAINSEEEFLAYYFIDNAIYRTSTIWDILAQIYNLHFDIGEDKTKIFYKTFFNNLGQNPKLKNDDTIKKINVYLGENNNTNTDKRWKGNHEYIKLYRNKLTHRNSPSVTSFSEYDLNIKQPPSFVLKRLIEDYNSGINFFIDIVNVIYQTNNN